MSDEITIAVAGDFCPSEHVEAAIDATGRPGELLGPAAGLFRRSDLSMVNLEYPLTRAESGFVKFGSRIKGVPKTISVLKEAGVGLVNLANNHILDFGRAGLEETLDTCRRWGIATVGAGLSREQASEPYRVTIKGRRIAVVGICENEFGVFLEGHGGGNPLDPVTNYYQIIKAAEEADVVIVSLHGGNEFRHYPSPEMVRRCRFFVDVGASAVVCHHPHWIQGYEVYHGAPILYSMGKLFYAKRPDPELLEVPVAELRFAADTLESSVEFRFFRLALDEMRLVDPDQDELLAIRRRFDEYCRVIRSEEALLSKWDEFCLGTYNKNSYLFRLLLAPVLFFRIARRLKMVSVFAAYAKLKRKQLLCLESTIRCEAHREAALRILEKERIESGC